MKKTGMTIPYVLNRIDGENVPLSPFKAKAYEEEYNVPGLFISYEDKYGVEIIGDSLPVSTIRGSAPFKTDCRCSMKPKQIGMVNHRCSSRSVCSHGA